MNIFIINMDIISKCVYIAVMLFYVIPDNVHAVTIAPPGTTTIPPVKETTLASDLILHNKTTVVILVLSILFGFPILVLLICAMKALVGYKREKKIDADDDDRDFVHPKPNQPLPRPFLQRDNTIAGPFRNPTFYDDDEGDNQSRTVTPSFISTRVVDEPRFGIKSQAQPTRYQYIP